MYETKLMQIMELMLVVKPNDQMNKLCSSRMHALNYMNCANAMWLHFFMIGKC